LLGKLKTVWHDADDGRVISTNHHLGADYVWVTAKPFLPQPITQNCYIVVPLPGVIRLQRAAERSVGPHQREEIAGNTSRKDTLRFLVARKQDAAAKKSSYLLKTLVLGLPIENVWYRHVALRDSLRRIDPFKQNNVFGLRKRQRTQQDGVHCIEDRAVGPDTQRQRDNGNSEKPGPLDQVANSVAYVFE
jgi:hypothetical protein